MTANLIVLDRAVLALVFALAAVAKLARRREFEQALPAFGISERLAPAVSFLVPLAEVAVCVLLVVDATGRWGAAAALCLLAAFSVVLAVQIARGGGAVCDCFGSLSAGAPAGWRTLARNAVLIAAAAAATASGASHDGPLARLGHLSLPERLLAGAVVVVALAVAALLVILVRLLREQERLRGEVATLRGGGRPRAYTSTEGLPVGQRAPAVTLTDGNGEVVAADAIAEARRLLVVLFTAPNCRACARLADDLARWHEAVGDRVALVTVNRGRQQSELAAEYFAVDPGGRVTRSFLSKGTPSAVLVTPEWKIATGLARGAGAVRELLGSVAESAGAAGGRDAAIGDQTGRLLPALSVIGPDGEPTELLPTDVRTLLFVDPGCPYSRRLADELGVGGREHRRLTTVSRTRENGHSLDLPAPVFTDRDGDAFRAAGVRATPAALVLDAGGTVLAHARGLTQVRHLLGLDGTIQAA